MDQLFKKGKIVSQNGNFMKFIISNLYLRNKEHPLAAQESLVKSSNIRKLKILIESQRNSEICEDKQLGYIHGSYALIEHCRGWPTLYYLFCSGFLTGVGDLPLPFEQSDIHETQCPGGTIAYYISGKCSPVELYFLLNLILYRQLGNRFSFLSTLAPVSIYQKMLENVSEMTENKNQAG